MSGHSESRGCAEGSTEIRASSLPLPDLFTITRNELEAWLENIGTSGADTRMVEGFQVTSSIDGGEIEGREVSLVTISSSNQSVYPQHFHEKSDARFYIISGSALFLSGSERMHVEKGAVLDIPRGKLHGFELAEGETLTFVSVQSPPIRDPQTEEEDLHLTDLT